MENSRETNWTEISFDGGELCLDFINTVSDRTVEAPREYLASFADLVNWLAYTRALPAQVLDCQRSLLPAVVQEGLYFRARALRALLYDIFQAIAEGRPAPPEGIDDLNAQLKEALAHRQVVPRDDRYGWEWKWPETAHPTALLWPLLLSAADTLISTPHDRIKACPACGWLFRDLSKNGSRTWCSMAVCGSASKARRYYQRKKKT